jgi:hypothetical protein
VIYQAQDRDPVLFWRVSWAGSGVIFALLMLGTGLAWLAARRSGRLRRRTLAWLATGLVFFDLAAVGAYVDLGTEAPTAGFEHPLVLAYLRSQPGFFRIDSRTDVGDVWQPDLALLEGLYDVGGVANPLVVADMARYWDGTGGRSTRLYDLLGVRYVLGSQEIVLDWSKFSPVHSDDPDVSVYRNESALPRAFVVYQAVVAIDHEDAWEILHGPGFEPAETVILEGGAPLASDPAGGGRAVVRVVRYDPDALEIEVYSPAEGYLVLTDPFFPGWRAKVDGEPARILRADYAFRAVAVQAGAHRLTMNYRPATASAGLVITLSTLAALVLGGMLALVRRWTSGASAKA